MVKSAESVEIARPADEVFRYVADLRNEPAWHVDVAAVPTDTDAVPVGNGARFTRAVELRPRACLMTPRRRERRSGGWIVMALLVPRRNTVFVANLKRVLEA